MAKLFNLEDFSKNIAVSSSDEFRGNGLIKIPAKREKKTRQKNNCSRKNKAK